MIDVQGLNLYTLIESVTTLGFFGLSNEPYKNCISKWIINYKIFVLKSIILPSSSLARQLLNLVMPSVLFDLLKAKDVLIIHNIEIKKTMCIIKNINGMMFE